MSYDVETRPLRRFEGFVNVRDRRGDTIVARIEFPRELERESDLAELAAARDALLDGRCETRE